MLLSTTQQICPWHVGAIGVHRYVKKYDKWPGFVKQDTHWYVPMSWLKLTLQEESSDLISAHPLHLRVFWAGIFQSAQCWLNSTIKFTGSDSQWFIRSRARPEIRPSEEVHSEILSWGAHVLKISCWAFLLVVVERNDPRKLEECTLVGKQMLLPWIFCGWRWWNSFWGSYEKSFLLSHRLWANFSMQPALLADRPVVSLPLCLWFWNVSSFHIGVWWTWDVCPPLPLVWCERQKI